MKRHSISFLLILLVIFSALPHSVSLAAPYLGSSVGETRLLLDQQVALRLQNLSLEEKIGQLFILAADGNTETLARYYHVGGFVLFSRHTETDEQTRTLISRLRTSSRIRPFIAVDQEGGRVARLDFITPVPAARRLGGLDESAVQKIAATQGQELHSLGFNLNFAPVLDVDTCIDNPVIGDRSFSSDPGTVARIGSAFVRGLHQGGVAAAGKHFPGHGDTSADSHLTLPVVQQPKERLANLELAPFRSAIKTGIDMIMTAHVHFPALDPTPALPASLSKPIITGLLRNELHFRGVIITDAMNMGAITNSHSSGSAALAAFLAGNDIILMPENFAEAYAAILSAVRAGKIPLSRIDDSVRRILKLKLQLD